MRRLVPVSKRNPASDVRDDAPSQNDTLPDEPEPDRPLPLIQVLLIEKHPPARLMPLTAVEVATPVRLKADVLIPPVNVDEELPLTVSIPVENEVLVEFVVVPFNPVKFCSVDDPLATKFAMSAVPA